MHGIRQSITLSHHQDHFCSRMVKEIVKYDHSFGYWKGKANNKRFVPLTNFAMKFLKFVKAPDQLPDYAGFIVEVLQKRGKQIVKGYNNCKLFTTEISVVLYIYILYAFHS